MNVSQKLNNLTATLTSIVEEAYQDGFADGFADGYVVGEALSASQENRNAVPPIRSREEIEAYIERLNSGWDA